MVCRNWGVEKREKKKKEEDIYTYISPTCRVCCLKGKERRNEHSLIQIDV